MIKLINQIGSQRTYEGNTNEYTYKFITNNIPDASTGVIFKKDISVFLIYNGEEFRRVDINGNSEDFHIFPLVGQGKDEYIFPSGDKLEEEYKGFVQTLDNEMLMYGPKVKDPNGGYKLDNSKKATKKEETPEEITTENEEKDKEIPTYKFSGTVVDSRTQEPLEGVEIEDSLGNQTTSGKEEDNDIGDKVNFSISGELIPKEKVTLRFSLKDHASKKKVIVTKNGKVRNDLKVIKLRSKKPSLETEEMKAYLSPPNLKEQWENFDKKGFVDALAKKIISEIITRLTPIVLKQLAEFGILNPSAILEAARGGDKEAIKAAVEDELTTQAKKKAEEEGEKLLNEQLQCPADMDGLNKIIAQKNKLTKSLNNIYQKVESISNKIKIPEKIIEVSNKAIPVSDAVIKALSFIPSTFATPIPAGPINEAAKIIIKLKELISVEGFKVTGMTLHLNVVLSQVKRITDLLAMLDFLIESCANKIAKEENLVTCTLPDGSTQQMTEEDCLAAGGTFSSKETGIGGLSNSELLVQEQVSQQLLDSTINQSNQLSPVVTNVNGFAMDVESEQHTKSLKRRRAIAKNTQGITMLRGEWSFSSNDQILIDELVFYIKQNNLKAE